MTLPLPTDTGHVRIESRQYRIFQWDLGEGIPRSNLKVAALIFVPWLLLMWAIGIPMLSGGWLFVWLLPPTLATWKSVQRDRSGRVGLQGMLDALAFRTQRERHRLINGETAYPDTGEELQAEFVILEDLR